MATTRWEAANRVLATRPMGTSWAGYTACAWAFIFAALSFYWAAGGTLGVSTNAPAITAQVIAREPLWIAIIWVTGVLKVLVGVLALALVRDWGKRFSRRLLLVAGWSATALLGIYEGAASLVQHALMVGGIIATPVGLGATSARWHLFLWDPWWLLGGLLIGAATWHYQRARSS